MAAQADAVTVAQQIHAFASIGGPAQTPAYEDELARCTCSAWRAGLVHLRRAPADAPYLWANLPTADTLLNEAVGYVFAKLNGKDAI